MEIVAINAGSLMMRLFYYFVIIKNQTYNAKKNIVGIVLKSIIKTICLYLILIRRPLLNQTEYKPFVLLAKELVVVLLAFVKLIHAPVVSEKLFPLFQNSLNM